MRRAVVAADITLEHVTDQMALAELTTLRLGGPAPSIETAVTADDLAEIVGAADRGDGALILGGGSNVVVADSGVSLPVVRVGILGVDVDAATGVATIGAGVPFDDAVAELVDAGWTGLEALSGIPGSAGATPVQNVGAYGVEISDLLIDIELYDRATRHVSVVAASGLGLGYRHSMLKGADRGVVTQVRWRLGRKPRPVAYPELARRLGVEVGQAAPAAAVRAAVLDLRRGKGMILDPADPDTASAGSFFTNPIVDRRDLAAVRDAVAARLGAGAAMPDYPVHGNPAERKLSAAWLIEHAGFPRGYPLAARPDAGIAVSTKHTLALTNRGHGTTAELLALAREIRGGVAAAFGVTLVPEPVLVGCSLD